MEEIDTEILISLVEERPVLWDKTQQIYKDRIERQNAWREICLVLKPDLDEKERNAFDRDVMRRWANIRDSFVKSLIRINDMKKSGLATKKVKKYVYSKKLQFLKKVYDFQETEESIKLESATEERTETSGCTENVNNVSEPSNTPSRQLSSKRVCTEQSRKHRKPDEVEMAMLRVLEREKPCSNTLFLQSLKPHLEKFDEQDYLPFQLGVLKVIEKINERKKMRRSNASTAFTQNTLSLPPNQVLHATYSSSPMGNLAPSYHFPGTTNPGLSRPHRPSTTQFYHYLGESLSSEDCAASPESNSDSIDLSS